MTLTIDEQKIELPPSVQAALEADAQAQARPVVDVLTDVLTERYLLPYEARVIKDGTGLDERTGADVLAVWEKEGAFLPLEDLPDSPELARQRREQAQAPRFDGTGQRL